MNDTAQMTSASGASLIPDGTSAITTMHLLVMAIFAALVIFGIVWGMRLSRRRRAAEREIREDNARIEHGDTVARDDIGSASSAPAAIPEPEPAPVPVPAAPAPPPLGDMPVVGTPALDDTGFNEPIAAPAPLTASPAVEAQHDASPEAATDAIPLTTLKGLGPKVAARLSELGISDARQLADLDDAAAADLDAQLGSFSGRMTRDRWVEQARLLAAGDTAGYEATFGRL